MNDGDTTVAELRTLMAKFVEERQWEPFHDPKNLASSIAIEAAELMEHFQWIRSEHLAEIMNDPQTVSEAGEELADIVAYVLSFANAMNIDISSALAAKMTKNSAKYPADRFRGRFR